MTPAQPFQVLGSPIRVAHIYTPAQGFNGYRRRVRFSQGEAALREPQVEDFSDGSAWLSEKQAFDQLIEQFRAMPGYTVRMKAEVDIDEFADNAGIDEPADASGSSSGFFDQPDEPEDTTIPVVKPPLYVSERERKGR